MATSVVGRPQNENLAARPQSYLVLVSAQGSAMVEILMATSVAGRPHNENLAARPQS
jgi:hypothetical protein